jgi:hypothetical protein
MLDHPILRIIEGCKDVVDVKVYAITQVGVYFLEKDLHVAAKLEDMAGVHEQ